VAIPRTFQELLDRNGHPLKAIGINEIALTQGDGLSAIATLMGSRVAILGGDVYRVEKNRITPTKDSWHVDRQSLEEGEDQYIRRTHDAARKFLETYPSPKDSSVLSTLGAKGVYIERYPSSYRPGNSSILFTLVLKELD